MTLIYKSSIGSYFPTGATVSDAGANFSVFSRHASGAELLLYEAAGSPVPFQIISLDPKTNRSFFFWHVFVEGLPVGTHYTWRTYGPTDTAATGRCFNPKKELVDPWAKAVTDVFWNRRRASDPNDDSRSSYRGVAVKSDYLWENERFLKRGLEGAVIYELHVGGFTRHPSSGVGHPGTFAGLIDKILYLQELGITHVELMPVMAFDEQFVPDNVAARGLKNYWGYNTHSFFSPHPGYCVSPELGTHEREFKELINALHNAGIGVILDVVFNHTAEGGHNGPMINFKGFINEIFYHLDPHNRTTYRDYTGCGNSVNCNHPLVTQFIVHCLEYWVEEMHVDGFRFDLASVFTRGEDGVPQANPSLPWRVEFSYALHEVPMIAEAWDASGLYHVGSFPGLRWAEWNSRYRDVIRRFVRGDPGLVGEVASCIAGSSDLYADEDRLPLHSINFISCHDGFTLHYLVSYNGKHNEANGEENREMLRFVKELIALRRRHPNLNRREYFTGEPVSGRGLRDIACHGYRLDEPLWFDYSAQYLAFTLAGLSDDEEDLHVILNMSERTVEATLPSVPGRLWHLALDTSCTGKDDIMPRDRQKAFEGSTYPITRRTVAAFEARG